jgi:hypothetical protein
MVGVASKILIVVGTQLEAGTSQPRRSTLDVVRRAFEDSGVEFINENGECAAYA